MKVLLVSNAFPNSAEPVRGIFTYQIVKSLQKMCDIEVVAPLPWIPPFLKRKFLTQYPHANVPLKERIGGIQVYHPRYFVIPKVLGFMHPMFMFLPLLHLIKRLNQQERIDVINAHWIFPDGVAAAWAAGFIGKPIVLTALGCDINFYPKLYTRRVQIVRTLRAANGVTAKSNRLKETIIKLKTTPAKISVIPNGVDPYLFRIMNRKKIRQDLGIPENREVVITVGSQDDVKGTRYLIEAVSLMNKNFGLLPLLFLIGDGPLRNDLHQQSIDLGISNHVTFLGKLPHDQIPLWLNAADVFCLPSLREGHPNVVLEALACGIPVVGSRVGSVPELIGEHNGRIFDVGDASALCNALMFCLKTRWNRSEIRKVIKGYDWDSCAESYYQVFLSALQADRNSHAL